MKQTLKRISLIALSLAMVFSMGFATVAEEEVDWEDFFSDLMSESEDDTTAEEEEPVINSEAEALQAAIDGGEVITIENGAVRLQLNKADGYLFVTEKATGKLWTSNPYNAQDDELASGITRTNLRAQLVVSYVEDNNLSSTNNYVASTNKDCAKYTVSKNCIRVDYTFKNEGFTIPVEYALTAKGFSVKVLFSAIQDTPERRVSEVEVLPYFGAAGLKDTGYMLVPDGSGALINFNNGKVGSFPYEKPFFGGDKGETPNTSTALSKPLQMPVYGMKNGDHAFAAVVTEGAETASLYACISGKQSNYNRIYTKAAYRVYATVNLKDSIGKSVYAKYTALKPVALPSYSVEYTLLSGKKASYTGMAGVAREWLDKNGLTKTETGEPQLFVDMYGAVEKEKAFLGIRYTGVQKLTTFEQAQEILEELKKAGVTKVTAGYRNFSTSTYKRKLSSRVEPASKLGGKKGYEALLDYASKNNVGIYPYADFVTFQKNGNSYWTFSDVILGLELSMIKRFSYTINEGIPDESRGAWYLVAGNRYSDAKTQILKSLAKYNSTGVLLDESANFIYNDFSPKGYQVDETVGAMKDIYGAVREQGQSILLSAPNAYAMTYATAITDMPLTSSQYVLFDQEVPFLQLVLKGQVAYSSESLNIEGVSDTTLLQLIETGSYPKFAMIYEEGKTLLNTTLDDLYGATYSACMPTALEFYNEVKAVAAKTKDATIVDHVRQSELVTVTYENGVKVYVNYAKTEQKASDGTAVPALGYRVVG